MGAILAGIIQGLGAHAAEQNSIKNHAQDKANEEMAGAFDTMAAQARTPEDAFRLHQMAYTARTKGAKAIPAAQLQYWQQQIGQGVQQAKQAQSQQQAQQSQQNQQAQGVVAQGTGLTPPAPPNPDAVQGNAGMMSQAPQPPTGIGGLASLAPPSSPPRPISAAAPTVPAASGTPPAMQQEAAAPSPNGVGGVGAPSPGFNGIAPPTPPASNGAWVVPPRRNRFQSPIVDTGGAPLNLRGPEEMQEFAARGKALEAMAGAPARIAEYKAQYGAQSAAQIALLEAKWHQAQQFLKEMQATTGGSGAHYAVKLGAAGPEVTEDAGTPLPRVYLGSSLPSGVKIDGDEPPDPKQPYTILRYKDGAKVAIPVATPLQQNQDINGNIVQSNRYVPGSAEAAGAVAPSLAAPRPFNLQGGGVGMASAGQLQAGGAPAVVPGAIGTGAPTTSVQNVPGQLPTVTTRTKGLTAPAPSTQKPAPSTNPAAPNAAVAAAADNSPIAVNYRNWVAGKATLSDKEQTAARQYAASHGLPTPNILDANAQKSIAAINPILEEIIHARQLLKSSGLIDQPELDSKLAMTKAFLKYKAGFTDDLTKAISDLSFDRIRSVGQALQGTGSRAYPIFQMGLEHTPQIGLNSDSGKMMDNKLEGMERRARESIAAAMTENKSGVAPHLQAPGVTPPAAAMPAGVPQVGDSFGGGKVVHIQRVQ